MSIRNPLHPPADPSGVDFVALTDLHDRRGDLVAAAGERCDRVAPESLAWLLEDGKIARDPGADDEEGLAS